MSKFVRVELGAHGAIRDFDADQWAADEHGGLAIYNGDDLIAEIGHNYWQIVSLRERADV